MDNPKTNSWETKTNMPTARSGLTSGLVNGKIYCIGGSSYYLYNTVEAYVASNLELDCKIAVEKAESSLDYVDVNNACELVNQLPEGVLKSQLQARLNAIFATVKENITSNVDLYIKNSNAVSLSLNTNIVSFNNFSGVEDLEKQNAINLTISSSLPYQINAYLVNEIQNKDKSKTMNKEILNIKENGKIDYQTFKNTDKAIVLKDNCVAENDLNHGIDFKLKGGLFYEQSIYKTVIKFEAKQK